MLATLIEWDALLKVVWAALAGTVGVTLAFSLAIVGGTGVAESRRNGRPVAAVAFGVLGVVALLICVGAGVLGITLMIQKD